jgi:hypothetical protein
MNSLATFLLGRKKYLIKSLGLLLAKNNFFKKNNKNEKNKIALEKLNKSRRKKEDFQKNSQIGLF